MSIQEDLLLIMKRSNGAKSTAEIDKCIREYKEILGEIEDGVLRPLRFKAN